MHQVPGGFFAIDECVAIHGAEKGKALNSLLQATHKTVYIAQNIYKNQKNN